MAGSTDTMAARGEPRDASAGAGGADVVQAAVVIPAGGQAATYSMFEADSVGPDGATLRGGLWLEAGEEVTLELRLPGQSPVRARARVVAILAGEEAQIRVEFVNLGDGDRQRLSRRVEPGTP